MVRCVNRSSLLLSDIRLQKLFVLISVWVWWLKRSFSPLWEQRNKLFSRGESHITHVAKKSPQDDRAMEMHHQNSPPQLQTSIFVPFSSLGTLIISRSLLRLSARLFFLNVSKKKTFLQNSSHSNQNSFKKNPPQNEPKKEEIVGRLAKTFPLW